MMFNQTLKSQNKPKIEPLVLGKADYNLDYVACNDNIHRISEGLKRSKKGRICCYGPPGTGKLLGQRGLRNSWTCRYC